MQITKTLKFKLYRNKKNVLLNQRIDVAGIVWNHCIALYKTYYRLTGKHLNRYALMKHLAKLKKQPKFSYWQTLDAQAIQNIVERIDRAYTLFFNNLKRGVKTAPPKFKKVKKYKSFTLKQANWKLLGGNKIRLHGVVYKFCQSREITGQIKTVTVKRDNLGALWLYFVVKQEIEVPDRSGNSAVGFDFGLHTFLTASDGTTYESPLFLKQSLAELRKANRALSRKKQGSKNWYKAKKNLAQVYAKVVNKRRDWFFKLAHDLTDHYDFLFFEDLNMKGMQKLWGRKVSDLARSEFMEILEWVAMQKGKFVGYVDRFFRSSQTCHVCGAITKLTLADRVWTCDCGTVHDRDFNASVNICTEGIRCSGVEDVRPVAILGRQPCLMPLESHVL